MIKMQLSPLWIYQKDIVNTTPFKKILLLKKNFFFFFFYFAPTGFLVTSLNIHKNILPNSSDQEINQVPKSMPLIVQNKTAARSSFKITDRGEKS